MPGVIHGFDDASDDEGLAFAAARGEEDVEIVLAILALFKLEKHSVLEWLHTKKKGSVFH